MAGGPPASSNPESARRPRRQNHIRIRLALLYVHAILAGPIRQIHGAILAGSTAAMLTTATLMIAQGGSSHEGCLDTKRLDEIYQHARYSLLILIRN